MASPSKFSNGPPLLPMLIDASVWIYSTLSRMPKSRPARDMEETTPTVTVLDNVNGAPTAITHSPGRTFFESSNNLMGLRWLTSDNGTRTVAKSSRSSMNSTWPCIRRSSSNRMTTC
ncbi:hypothetical protein DERF_005805 [Dermatophagoides farinae]|uniref:Uncharacterized protein n=1 Tax=Dermatophagoides farinae TaxID=6954 RepID=A0A922IA91_DERFA|nr:hypothetical protein DERF_005805 [Dermatophagoides farinae]